jgi:hypothetical protein
MEHVYLKPTAPRSIGGVLDDAIRLYRVSFAKTWPLALCGRLLLAAPLLILQFQFAGAPTGDTQAMLGMIRSPSTWLPYLVATIITIGFYNALLVQIDGFAAPRVETFGRSLGTGFRLLPRTLFLFIVMIAAATLAGIGVGVAFGLLTAVASVVVRIILVAAVLLLGIYAWGRAFLANVALVVEDAGAFKSLGLSWTLIRDHWWRTATVYTIAIIIILAFNVVIAIVDGLVATLLHDYFAVAAVIGQLVAVIGGAVVMPFVPAVLLVMYYDLKLRKEGTDLAGRVNALTAQ